MNMRWIKGIVLIMFAVMLVLTGACSNDQESEDQNEDINELSNVNESNGDGNDATNETTINDAEPEEEKEPVTLTLHTWFVGPNQALFDKFHEMYPWITIEANTNINEAVINNIIAGEESDLVFLDAGLSQWMSGDLLEELTPYIEQDERIQNANLVEGFLESFQTGGKQYTVPYSDIPMWIVINKDLMEKYGMEMPSNDWTYEDMLEMAKKATNPAAGDWGMIGMTGELAQILTMANGSADNYRYMNEENTQSLLDTPAVMEDLKWVQELSTRWHVRPNSEEMAQYGFEGDPGTTFLKGNFLFMIGADWYLPGLNENASFEWDVLPMPRGKERQATVHQAGPIAIPKASKHKEEAFMYISFLFSDEAQKLMIENGSNAFVINDTLNSYYDQVDMWQGKNVEAIRMAQNMCCFSKDPTIVDFTDYVWGPIAKLDPMLLDGGNLDEVIPHVEAYNKKAIESREALGW